MINLIWDSISLSPPPLPTSTAPTHPPQVTTYGAQHAVGGGVGVGDAGDGTPLWGRMWDCFTLQYGSLSGAQNEVGTLGPWEWRRVGTCAKVEVEVDGRGPRALPLCPWGQLGGELYEGIIAMFSLMQQLCKRHWRLRKDEK